MDEGIQSDSGAAEGLSKDGRMLATRIWSRCWLKCRVRLNHNADALFPASLHQSSRIGRTNGTAGQLLLPRIAAIPLTDFGDSFGLLLHIYRRSLSVYHYKIHGGEQHTCSQHFHTCSWQAFGSPTLTPSIV